MAATERDLRIVFRAIDRVTAPAQRIAGAVQRMSRETGLDRLARAAGGASQQLGRVGVAAIGVGRTAAILGGTGAGGLAALVRGFTGTADALAKTADKIGVGVVGLQRLRYAGELAGVSTQTVDMALQRFTRRAAEAAQGTGEARDALAQLGIRLRDSSGQMRPTEGLLADVADAMARIEDPSERVRIAFKLFDSEGVAMVNMLRGGSAGLREAGLEMGQLGFITESQARDSERFNDEWTRFLRVVQHTGHAIAADLLPQLTPLIGRLRDLAVEWRPRIVERAGQALSDIAAMGRDVAAVVRELAERVGAWWAALVVAVPVVAALVEPLARVLARMGLFRAALVGVAAFLGGRLLLALGGLAVSLLRLSAAIVGVLVRVGVLAVRAVPAAIRAARWMGRQWGLLGTRIGLARLKIAAWTAAVRAAGRRMWALAAGAARSVAAAFGRMAAALGPLIAKTWAWTVALLANPIGLVIAGIAAAAALVYLYWDDIVAFLKRVWSWLESLSLVDVAREWIGAMAATVSALWGRVTSAFDLGAIVRWLGSLTLRDVVRAWIDAMAAVVSAWWHLVTGAFDLAGLVARLAGLSLGDTARAWIGSLADGVSALWGRVTEAFDLAGLVARLAGLSLGDTARAWIGSLADGVADLWGRVTEAFDLAGLVARLAGLSLGDTARAWIGSLADGVSALWGRVTEAFDLAGLVARLAGLSLGDTARAWIGSLADGVSALWGRVTEAFDLAGLVARLAGLSLGDTARAWIGSLADGVADLWGRVTEAFDLAGLVARLAGLSLGDTARAWIGSLADGVADLWGRVTEAFDLGAIVRWLGSVDWLRIGAGWIRDMWAGIRGAWRGMLSWIAGQVADLLDLLPDFVLKGAGVDVDAIRQTAAALPSPAGPAGEAIPSLIGPETRLAVGGEVRLYFEGAPRDLRVGRVRSDNPDVPIDVTLGYAMAGT